MDIHKLYEQCENPKVLATYEWVFREYLRIHQETINRAIEAIGKTGGESYVLRGKERDLLMAFSKVERKFRRAEHITFNYDEILRDEGCSEKELLEYLRDAYFDSINYNIMAVIILDKIIDQTEEGKECDI